MINCDSIIILGMHRSGTSLLANVVKELGFYGGEESDFTGANNENPMGFWERRDIRNLNDNVLWENNCDWYRVSRFNILKFSDSSIKSYAKGMSEVLGQLSSHAPWFVKEPRLSLLFPLLADQLANSLVLIIARNPDEVALSLKKRNGFTYGFSKALSTYYRSQALFSTRDRERLLLYYDELLNDPHKVINSILEKYCALSGDDINTFEGKINSAAAVIDRSLHRNVVSSLNNEWKSFEYTAINKQLKFSQSIYSALLEGEDMVNMNFKNDVNGINELKSAVNKIRKDIQIGWDGVYDSIQVACSAQKVIYDTQLVEQRDKYSAQIVQQKEKYDTQLTELKEKYDTQLTELKEKYDTQLTELKEKYDTQLSEQMVLYSEQSRLNSFMHNELVQIENKLKEANDLYDKVSNEYIKAKKCIIEYELLLQNAREQEMRNNSFVKRASFLAQSIYIRNEDTIRSWRWRLGNGLIRPIEFFLRRRDVVLSIDDVTSQTGKLRNVINRIECASNQNGVLNSVFTKAHIVKPLMLAGRKGFWPRGLVSIVIPVYNGKEFVDRCIKSVGAYTYVSYELIIVDDCSNSDTAMYLKSLDGVTLLRNDQNLGFTKSVNLGLRRASGEHIVILNSDTQVTSLWLYRMLKVFDAYPDVGIVGPLSNAASYQSVPFVKDPKGNGWFSDAPSFSLEFWAAAIFHLSDCLYPSVPFINGFCFMISRDVLTKVGYLDEISFPRGYGEENDYCIRAAKAGFELRICDNAYVFHEKTLSFTNDERKNLSKLGRESLEMKHTAALLSERIAIMDVESSSSLCSLRDKLNKLEKPKAQISICYLLPAGSIGGGVISVIQSCQTLIYLGYNAYLLVPDKFRDKLDVVFNFPKANTVSYSHKTEIGSKLCNMDMVVATHNSTVKIIQQSIMDYKTKARPFYFVQDYEPKFYEVESDDFKNALESYSLIPSMIAFSKTNYLIDIVSRNHPEVDIRKIPPGLNKDIYFPSISNMKFKSERVIRICAMIRPRTIRRAPKETISVLRTIKSKYGDLVEIVLFGCSEKDFIRYNEILDFSFDFKGVLDPSSVFDCLLKSDIFLDLSVYQAFGRTALEAMAAGCIAVAPEHCGPNDFIETGVDSFTVNTANLDEVFELFDRFITGDLRSEIRSIQKRAICKAAQYDLVGDALGQLEAFGLL